MMEDGVELFTATCLNWQPLKELEEVKLGLLPGIPLYRNIAL